MKTIPFTQQRIALQTRFPNAFVEPYDSVVVALTAEGWQTMHREFHFWLGLVYTAETGDCDDFMREFHAYVKRRHRAGKVEHALGCYDLIYCIDGNLFRKHAINVVWVLGSDGDVYLSELEPQPNGGLFFCNAQERLFASACLG